MSTSSKAKIHPIFQRLLQELAAQAKAMADAAQGQGQRRWQSPPDSDWNGDVLDIAGMDQAFDREAINQNFAELFAASDNAGTIGDATSLKLQGDYVAVVERAYRARVATPLRCMAHAAARRAGHGHAAGVFTGGVLQYAQDAIKAGQIGAAS